MGEIVELWVHQEAAWYKRLKDAIRAGTLQRFPEDTAICPTCNKLMDFVDRGDRMTFAGPEPACSQVQCDHCGFGVEITK
jgi:hypothetical protein